MSRFENPRDVIVPIIGMPVAGEPRETLLGTGFFVGQGMVMSAKHVLGDGGSQIVPQVLLNDGSETFVKVGCREVFSDPVLDIAVARFKAPFAHPTLELRERAELAMNRSLMSIEYSPTAIPAPGTADTAEPIPNWHMGHAVRAYVDQDAAGHPSVLHLSFPAIVGASGAPVVDEKDREVVAMVIGSRSQELAPSQVVRLEAGEDVVEEIRYHLPHAYAIHVGHLRDALGAARAQFDASGPLT